MKYRLQAWEGQKCDYMLKDPQTMHAKRCLSCGRFPGCSALTRCCAHTPGRTNWFVPSGVHLERRHRYGMHTSPGGRWCHCGTCPLHSQPVSTAQIYLHSRLFSRELNRKQQRSASCLQEVCELMEFLIAYSLLLPPLLDLKKQRYNTSS